MLAKDLPREARAALWQAVSMGKTVVTCGKHIILWPVYVDPYDWQPGDDDAEFVGWSTKNDDLVVELQDDWPVTIEPTEIWQLRQRVRELEPMLHVRRAVEDIIARTAERPPVREHFENEADYHTAFGRFELAQQLRHAIRSALKASAEQPEKT